MSDKDMTLAQNMESMKESIEKAGGLFYQYRPCRRNAETIYDIENIRHGVVYAQTPLNMNDPFDSMIGFSAEKVYAECISMLADALECDKLTKEVIVTLLQHRAFGKMAELILVLKEIKTYVNQRRTVMHQTSRTLEFFVNSNAKVLYNKAPKKLRNSFVENTFYALMIIISKLGDVDISEENIFSMLKMDEMLDNLHKTAIELRDSTYTEQLRNFLSKITVSCFSTSGWDNQLMWSHYANSYSGICVEYDFSKLSDFVGFVYPVKYSKDRPTLSLKDVGIGRISIEGTNNIENCDVDITNIISYMLCKNTCWEYEKEWRIINIGEENTPLFIDLPFVKSITFGPKIDILCKKLLMEICQEKRIDCYELTLNAENYCIDRISVDLSSISGDIDEEILDLLSNVYFVKKSMNRAGKIALDELVNSAIPNGITTITNLSDASVIAFSLLMDTLEKSILSLSFGGKIKYQEYRKANNQIRNIRELIEKINSYEWNCEFIKNSKNKSDVISHYDLLIDEGNDPVYDSEQLQVHMDKWDGKTFIDAMGLSSDKKVLEIGVGTGRLAVKIAPLCAWFTGIDISPKTIEKAKINLASNKNITLVCSDFISADIDERQFDVIYSSLTFMHISNKLSAMKKVSEILKDEGIFVLSIEKNQEEILDYGTRSITIYPDTVDNIQTYATAVGMVVDNVFETEFAKIIILKKACLENTI